MGNSARADRVLSKSTSSTALPGREVPSWHILPHLRQVLPDRLVSGLLAFKRRVLLRTLPRHTEFRQSPEARKASACFSVVVAIHDAPRVTYRCLASLERYAPDAEIILVDDGSLLRETNEMLRQFGGRDHWRLVRHQKALGHSEACRSGARVATRPYLCLLNSDTVVTPWCWLHIKEAFEQDPRVGIAGPSTSHTGNSQSMGLAEFLSAHWNDNQICAFAERLLTQSQESPVVDLPWIAGCALFVSRALWEQVDGFDRNLPDYGNEIDLCGRVADSGYRVVWVRNSYIHHFGRQSYRDTFGDQAILERIQAAEAYTARKKRSSLP